MDTGRKTFRNLLVGFAAVAVAIAVVTGISEAPDASDGTDQQPTATEEDFERALADAPPKLAAIYEQGDALLDGGADALRRHLAELEGTPVVVNAWASWCGPCRFEFPHFQSQAIEHGDRVAFLGVNVEDSAAAAETFLGEFPLPYPSYIDGEGEISDFWNARRGLPVTAFYDSGGELVHLREGPYRTEAELDEDIDRYAK